jgi:hypothetical protein
MQEFQIQPSYYARMNNFNPTETIILLSIFDETISLDTVKESILTLMNDVGEGTHSEVTNEMIPKHYTEKVIEPIEFILKNNLNFCQGNSLKYISRYTGKNKALDLAKVWWYIWTDRHGSYQGIPNLMDNK